MSGFSVAVIIALALGGAGLGYLVWLLIDMASGRGSAKGDLPPELAEKPGPAIAALPPLPQAPPAETDAALAARIAALRSDLSVIARAQAAILETQGEREGRMLAEIRAIAETRDASVHKALARIEALLGGGDNAAQDGSETAAQLVQMGERARPSSVR